MKTLVYSNPDKVLSRADYKQNSHLEPFSLAVTELCVLLSAWRAGPPSRAWSGRGC